jgi:hypothetical protein
VLTDRQNAATAILTAPGASDAARAAALRGVVADAFMEGAALASGQPPLRGPAAVLEAYRRHAMRRHTEMAAAISTLAEALGLVITALSQGEPVEAAWRDQTVQVLRECSWAMGYPYLGVPPDDAWLAANQ